MFTDYIFLDCVRVEMGFKAREVESEVVVNKNHVLV
jgi:hypothetical protein